MKKNILGIGTVGAVLALAGQAQAAEWTRHFRLGLDVAFNIDATFEQSGVFARPSSVGAPGDGGGVDREYDDGFVRVDSTGNGGGLTSNWGFTDRGSQYDPAGFGGDGSLTYRRATSFSTTGGGTTEEDAPYMGLDAVYGMSTPWRENISVGFDIGFNFLPLEIRDRRTLAASRTETVHRYDLNGMRPPGGGPDGANSYAGSDTGVGPLLNDTPSTAFAQTLAGTLSGFRGLEGNLYSIRFGPMARWQFAPYWSLAGSVGASVALLHADMIIEETMSSVGAPDLSLGSRNSDSDLAYGGYIGAVVTYDTGYYWDAFVGVHLVSMSDAEIQGGGRRASLSLGSGIHITAGINWNF